MPYELFKDGFNEHTYLLDVRWDIEENVSNGSSVDFVVTEFDKGDQGKPRSLAVQLKDPEELKRLEKAIRRARKALE